MRLAAVLLTVGLLLGAGASAPKVSTPPVNQTVYNECWHNHWPTYRKNIQDGLIGRAEGQAKLDRVCRAEAQGKESK